MNQKNKESLDLRCGYTIDEVEELHNGRLIKMSLHSNEPHKGHRKPGMRGTTTAALVCATAAIMLSAFSLSSSAVSLGTKPEPNRKVLLSTQSVFEDPMEAEKIEAALVEQGYFREDIPLNYELQDAIRTACEANGIPYHVALGLIEVESSFDPEAVSPAGCYGLAQLNPEYFPSGLSPAENITTGMEFLAYQLERYDGDMRAALTAYNAGHDTGGRGYAAAVLEAAEKWQ